MGNPVSWDNVETLTEGLITIAGWNGIQDETRLAAELPVVWEKDYSITFVVSETPSFLQFVVRLELNSMRDIDEARFSTSIELLTRVCIEVSLPQYLQLATWEPKNVVYEFVYPWKCDASLQQAIGLPYLHGMVTDWSRDLSMPAMSLAPLLGFYLRGVYKSDAEFILAARQGLGMIAVPTQGNA